MYINDMVCEKRTINVIETVTAVSFWQSYIDIIWYSDYECLWNHNYKCHVLVVA